MNIAVVNAHLPNYAELAAITTYGNRKEYCALHGYDLHVMTSGWRMPARHPVSWDRLAFAVSLLKSGKYGWVYICGTDTLHTNFRIRIEHLIDLDYHVIAASEWCSPIQADSVLIRNSRQGLGWAETILGAYEQYKNNVWVEQSAMIESLKDNMDIIKLLPQRRMNSYNYPLYREQYPNSKEVANGVDCFGNDGQWKVGDFLIHWPGIPLVMRINEAKRLLPLVHK